MQQLNPVLHFVRDSSGRKGKHMYFYFTKYKIIQLMYFQSGKMSQNEVQFVPCEQIV